MNILKLKERKKYTNRERESEKIKAMWRIKKTKEMKEREREKLRTIQRWNLK